MENEIFELCKLKNSSFGKCGVYSNNKNGLVPVKDLTDFVTLSSQQKVLERKLIENRINQCLGDDDLLCSKHRFYFGSAWKPNNKCYHPRHNEPKLKKRKCSLRSISKKMFDQIIENFGENSIPIGALICTSCRFAFFKTADDNDNQTDKTNTMEDHDDKDYSPTEVSVINSYTEDINAKIQLSRVKAIVSCSDVQHVLRQPIYSYSSTSVLSNVKKDFESYMNACKDLYLQAICPGQEGALANFLMPQNTINDHDEIINIFQSALSSSTSKQSRVSVLSCIPRDKFSPLEIQKIFHCSRREEYDSRNIFQEYGACAQISKDKQKRRSLSFDAGKHFIDFLMVSGSLQESAYLTTELEFENGLKETIAQSIMTAKREHIVKDYIEYCEENNLTER